MATTYPTAGRPTVPGPADQVIETRVGRMADRGSPSGPVADLLDDPGVPVRVGEVGEAGVVAALRIDAGCPTAQPVVDRRFVPDVADLDAAAGEFPVGRFDVGDDEI